VATKRKQKQMKKATRILMLVGTFYLFGGCKPATTTDPTPTAPDYIGKWGNNDDFCNAFNENPLLREAVVTISTDKVIEFSLYDCTLKTRSYATYTYSITNNKFKFKWFKSVDSKENSYQPNPKDIERDESYEYSIGVTADGKKLTFTPAIGDLPALRTFVKR
jgi:hypothetical protein